MDNTRLRQRLETTRQNRTGELVQTRTGPVRIPAPGEITDIDEFADKLSKSGLLPNHYRLRPANILWAVEFGRMLKIPTMAAITGVWVIEGKPSSSAALINMLVRRAAHKLRIKGGVSFQDPAYAAIIRTDDPDFEFRSDWTFARAMESKLVQLVDGRPWARSKDGHSKPWELYAPALLKARATTEVARDAAQDALFGLQYTPEELGAEVDRNGVPTGRMIDPVGADDAYYYDAVPPVEQMLAEMRQKIDGTGEPVAAPTEPERIVIDPRSTPDAADTAVLDSRPMDWDTAIKAAIGLGAEGLSDLAYTVKQTEPDNTGLVARIDAVEQVLTAEHVNWDNAIRTATELGVAAMRDLWWAAQRVEPGNPTLLDRINTAAEALPPVAEATEAAAVADDTDLPAAGTPQPQAPNDPLSDPAPTNGS